MKYHTGYVRFPIEKRREYIDISKQARAIHR